MQLSYTSEMEKGLQQRHGISYAEYESSLDKRLKIEQERTNEHDACNRLVQSIQSQTP
ncbi:hypothetical protein JCM19045_3761 [Bacillus sp. JCM 19045]|uniref:3-hydroxy-3-methylglutaryl CoA synthase n=1 Tax=Shouchella xiaoxiensis TaxID=766895 RepID=A0ABS2SYB8_9BACI|nr:hypothetical protein [Shouchella xiaoxiensis]MBM7840531.1 3-hydroxy-3-methylglutaryl CoA synthase [Shouchella xiaoxiensis]GAF14445.1 hypothetical protein JCM19045_3761 [Bacillus sp. JCM 19045]